MANPTGWVGPLGLSGGPYGQYYATRRHSRSHESSLDDDVKAYLCRKLEECHWSIGCVLGASNAERKTIDPSTGRNRWHDPILRQAENFSWIASERYPTIVGYGGVFLHQFIVKPPAHYIFNSSTQPSLAAARAGFSGASKYRYTESDWEEWCE